MTDPNRCVSSSGISARCLGRGPVLSLYLLLASSVRGYLGTILPVTSRRAHLILIRPIIGLPVHGAPLKPGTSDRGTLRLAPRADKNYRILSVSKFPDSRRKSASQLKLLQAQPPSYLLDIIHLRTHNRTAAMGRDLQKRKNRSSRPTVRQSNRLKKPLNPLGNSLIAQNW